MNNKLGYSGLAVSVVGVIVAICAWLFPVNSDSDTRATTVDLKPEPVSDLSESNSIYKANLSVYGDGSLVIIKAGNVSDYKGGYRKQWGQHR